MSSFSFNNVALRAFAAATPSNVIKADLSDRRAAKFVKQMGVEQVHLSALEQTPIDLGYVALTQALAQVQWQPQDLDLVIFDTQSPDFWGGASDSSLIHHYFNLREDCATFDMSVGCSAFPYSLTVACSMLQNTTDVKKIALLMGDVEWSSYRSKEELLTSKQNLFGDATGVVLLEKIDAGAAPAITTKLFAQGHGYLHLFSAPTTRDVWHRDAPHYILPNGVKRQHDPNCLFSYMDGIAIHEFSTGKVVDCIKEQYGAAIQDYDYYVFHQANKQIISTITARLELDPSKVLISYDQYGNTAAATALTTICHKLADLDRPAHIFNASFGIGLSWGFSDFIIEPHTVSAIIPTDHHFTEHCLKPVYEPEDAAQ